MGKGDDKSSGTLAATLGANGQVNYDAILKQSKLSERDVTSDHGALVPKLDAINKNVYFPTCPESTHFASSDILSCLLYRLQSA